MLHGIHKFWLADQGAAYPMKNFDFGPSWDTVVQNPALVSYLTFWSQYFRLNVLLHQCALTDPVPKRLPGHQIGLTHCYQQWASGFRHHSHPSVSQDTCYVIHPTAPPYPITRKQKVLWPPAYVSRVVLWRIPGLALPGIYWGSLQLQ